MLVRTLEGSEVLNVDRVCPIRAWQKGSLAPQGPGTREAWPQRCQTSPMPVSPSRGDIDNPLPSPLPFLTAADNAKTTFCVQSCRPFRKHSGSVLELIQFLRILGQNYDQL